jgi:hypothetical protein
MSRQPFFTRLKTYYESVGAVLRGEADAAATFPNSSDVGLARENVYIEFLRAHAPSRCNIFLGGFLFDSDGRESRQLDVIITNDTTPQFNFHNRGGTGKSFAHVEGTLGVVSIKSNLDGAQIKDALEGIASIPPTASLADREVPGVEVKGYDDWPLKIVYASNGISPKRLLMHIMAFYHLRPNIPATRRPNIIHVAGRYVLLRTTAAMKDLAAEHHGVASKLQSDNFNVLEAGADLQGIQWVIQGLQEKATASSYILWNYGEMINRVNALLPIPPLTNGRHFEDEDLPEALEIITQAAAQYEAECLAAAAKKA